MEENKGKELKNVKILGNDELRVRFISILRAGSISVSPELEKYAWGRFARKIEDGEIDISLIENNEISEIAKICIPIKKEYYEKAGIITDINGNPNIAAIMNERPELIKENAEVASIVKVSEVNLEQIEFDKISIDDFFELLNKEGGYNVLNSIYAQTFGENGKDVFDDNSISDREKMDKKVEEIESDEEKKNKYIEIAKSYNLADEDILNEDQSINKETYAMLKVISEIKSLQDKLINPETKQLDLRKEDEARKLFEAISIFENYLGNRSKNFGSNMMFQQIALSYSHIICGRPIPDIRARYTEIQEILHPEKVYNFLELQRRLEEKADTDITFDEEYTDGLKSLNEERYRKNYETYVKFSEKQKSMYKVLKSINIKELKRDEPKYDRNKKLILGMYINLKNANNLPEDKKAFRDVLKFYIELPENNEIFGEYLKNGEIQGQDLKFAEDDKNIVNLIEDFSKLEEGNAKISYLGVATSEKLISKIDMFNKDINPKDISKKYLSYTEKIKKIEEKKQQKLLENKERFKNLRKEKLSELKQKNATQEEIDNALKEIDNEEEYKENVILGNSKTESNYLKIEVDTIDRFVRENPIIFSKYTTEKNGQNVLDIDLIKKNENLKEYDEKTKIAEIANEYTRLKHQARFDTVSLLQEKLDELQEEINKSDIPEYYSCYCENKDGKLIVSPEKVNEITIERMNFLASLEAKINIENIYQRGIRFEDCSSIEKAEYLKNVLSLILIKDNKTHYAIAELALEQIEKNGIDIRDNIGNLSEDKIINFYNSFVNDNNKIDKIEEITLADFEHRYEKLDRANMQANSFSFDKAIQYSKRINDHKLKEFDKIKKNHEKLTKYYESLNFGLEDKLNPDEKKVYDMMKKLDFKEKQNVDVIINLYWTAKSKAINGNNSEYKNIYKSLEKVMTMDEYRSAFSKYIKVDFVTERGSLKVFDVESNIKNRVQDDKNYEVKDEEKAVLEESKIYAKALKQFDSKEKFEKSVQKIIESEREKNPPKTEKELAVEEYNNLKSYLEMVDTLEKTKDDTSPKVLKKRAKLLIRTKNREENFVLNPRYAAFVSKGENGLAKFDRDKMKSRVQELERIVEEEKKITAIIKKMKKTKNDSKSKGKQRKSEEKLQLPITPQEETKLEEKSTELNAGAIEEQEQKSKDSTKKPEPLITPSEERILEEKSTELNADAIELENIEKRKPKEEKEEKIDIKSEGISEVDNKPKQPVKEEIPKQESFGEQGRTANQESSGSIAENSSENDEDKKDVESVVQRQDISFMSWARNGIKSFVDRFTKPRLTDGSGNSKNSEEKEGFFTKIMNKIKGDQTKDNVDVKTEEQKLQDSLSQYKVEVDERQALEQTEANQAKKQALQHQNETEAGIDK